MTISTQLRVVPGITHHTGPAPYRPEFVTPSAGERCVAVVLSAPGDRSTRLLPVLAGLGVTAIDRFFDREAHRIVAALQPELAILRCDPAQPDGVEMIRAIAASRPGRLLVVDTGGSPTGTIAALELGADATLRSDDDAAMVRATLASLLRRVHSPRQPLPPPTEPKQLRVGLLTIDYDTCEARHDGELLPLTRTEFQILGYLAARAGKVQSPGKIMSAIHEYTYTDAEAQQAVKVYIRRIRRKLAGCSSQSVEIVNSRSFGYRLQVTSPEELFQEFAA
jgi:DNA-binding response OmpR family regulator